MAKQSESTNEISLGDLADNFLSQANDGLQIPNLFGSDASATKAPSLEIPNIFASSSQPLQIPELFTCPASAPDIQPKDEEAIDLMQALSLSSESFSKDKVTRLGSVASEELEQTSCETRDLILRTFFSNLQDLSPQKTKNESRFGHVLRSASAKSEKTDKKTLEDITNACQSIQRFQFDTPSPDDIVKAAQGTAFKRAQ